MKAESRCSTGRELWIVEGKKKKKKKEKKGEREKKKRKRKGQTRCVMEFQQISRNASTSVLYIRACAAHLWIASDGRQIKNRPSFQTERVSTGDAK